MAGKYNQFRAMLAITRAGLQSMLRSPSSIMFSIGFPLVFILVFGFMGDTNKISLKIAVDHQSDTLNPIYFQIKNAATFDIVEKSKEATLEDVQKGRIVGIISIKKSNDPKAPETISITTSHAVSTQNISVLKTMLNAEIDKMDRTLYPNAATVATVEKEVNVLPGRVYRTIDFILPGMMGFSLLAAGIFGVAFLFFNLRQQLVLKRFFATPISRTYIVLGEALSRVIFQMVTAVIIIAVGVFAFHFTLIHGWITFLEIMLLSFFSLVIFMGCGFIVGSVAKTESAVPPLANIFTMPQFLLAGTFFSIESFPQWLQTFCNFLPLTHFNNAMRNIAFEGASLFACWPDLLNLTIWGIIVYAIAIKLFRWE
ncbi:ABC transporter permease [Rhizosphaericola mali]|uniref:ABC transporter permease n=1 Tax=Rhizosphaericola mali TaxID=2545455 RepID=A0A5P2G932_9BACT|nr:ABC transporter permease [Rhizosphaericola mali]QES90452.1 ABC transporter permease [Rhizosphaericola mali]